MALFDKIKKIFGLGGEKPEPVKQVGSPSPSAAATKEQTSANKGVTEKASGLGGEKPEAVKQAGSPSPSAAATKEQTSANKGVVVNGNDFLTLFDFLTLIRLDMLECWGVYSLNLDPDDNDAFVQLSAFAGAPDATTLYGAFKNIERRIGRNWSIVAGRCKEKEEKLSPLAKSPLVELRKWEEIRQTVMHDTLNDIGANAPVTPDLNEKKEFYALCNAICNTKLEQLRKSIG